MGFHFHDLPEFLSVGIAIPDKLEEKGLVVTAVGHVKRCLLLPSSAEPVPWAPP